MSNECRVTLSSHFSDVGNPLQLLPSDINIDKCSSTRSYAVRHRNHQKNNRLYKMAQDAGSDSWSSKVRFGLKCICLPSHLHFYWLIHSTITITVNVFVYFLSFSHLINTGIHLSGQLRPQTYHDRPFLPFSQPDRSHFRYRMWRWPSDCPN